MSPLSFLRRIPLRTQGLLWNGLPLFAVLFSASFAYISNQQRERTEISLSRHFELVENLVDLRLALLNSEAEIAAQLLANRAASGDAGQNARIAILEKMTHIRTLIEAVPKPVRRAEKLVHFEQLQTAVNAELKYLDAFQAEMAASSPDENLSVRFSEHRPAAEALALQVSEIGASEHRLLAKRLDQIRIARQRDYLLIILSVVVGLATRAVALYFFHRSVVRRVRRLTQNARQLRDGAQPLHQPSESQDDIGELERELASIGDFLAERRMK